MFNSDGLAQDNHIMLEDLPQARLIPCNVPAINTMNPVVELEFTIPHEMLEDKASNKMKYQVFHVDHPNLALAKHQTNQVLYAPFAITMVEDLCGSIVRPIRLKEVLALHGFFRQQIDTFHGEQRKSYTNTLLGNHPKHSYNGS
jgi:hypothetical protein